MLRIGSFLLVTALLVAPEGANAQARPPSLVAAVVDPTGGALIGASCELSGSTTARPVAVVGADGHCRFEDIIPGAYRLAVSLSGFQSRTVAIETHARVKWQRLGDPT